MHGSKSSPIFDHNKRVSWRHLRLWLTSIQQTYVEVDDTDAETEIAKLHALQHNVSYWNDDRSAQNNELIVYSRDIRHHTTVQNVSVTLDVYEGVRAGRAVTSVCSDTH